MKKNLKKGDGLATVIIGIVFIVLVLLIVPAFKGLQKSGTQQSKGIAITNENLTTQALTDAAGMAGFGYKGDNVTTGTFDETT